MEITSSNASLHGSLLVCGSKSHTIRAVILAALSEGTSVIHNPLKSQDAYHALHAVAAMGATVEERPDGWVITGKGRNLSVPENYIDTGNSGTTTFFIMSVAALCTGSTFITGDEQIRRRPVLELAQQLCRLGADVRLTRPGNACPPVIVSGPAHGGTVRFCGTNSQFVSGLMLTAPLFDGDTEIWIDDPWEKPYLQLTLDWMKRFGAEITNENGEYRHFLIRGGQSYHPCDCTVPADWSSALFPLAAAVMTPSELVIEGVDFQDSQGDKIVVEHLISMGADIVKDEKNHRMTVHGGRPLHGLDEICMQDIPDSLPILSLAAAYAEGTTRFTGLTHVRVKESDRVAVMEDLLSKMGGCVSSDPTTMTVRGGVPLHGIVADSRNDHRIAMTMAVAGMWVDGGVTIQGAEYASTSFPGFYSCMEQVGAVFSASPDPCGSHEKQV